MSKFFIDSTSESADTTPAYVDSPSFGSDDEDTLPYPAELARNDFLAPDFDAQTYLSSLRNRHQTLEDLRSDLRQRSQLLNRELLDLVNGNYEEFLSLGGDLKGGEEKVEGVRVGLLGFQREVEGIRKAVQDRARETGELLQEKKGLRKEIVLGRALLEVHERLEELEEKLGIKTKEGEEDDEDDDEDEEDDTSDLESSAYASAVKRLRKQSEQYLLIVCQSSKIGQSHPFLVSLQPRVDEVRKTLILDLSASLRQAKSSNDGNAVLGLSQVFGALDAQSDALKVLKGG
ncbi:hypothetical protein MBLNU13_g07836t1 [Cladosporium sp. NU13]